MANFRIPDSQIEGFKHYVSATPDQREKINSIISNSRLGKPLSEITKEIALALNFSDGKAQAILTTIGSLLSIEARLDDDIDAFVDGMIEAYYRQTKQEKKDIEIFISQFKNLLSNKENFKITLKARTLIYEREKILEHLRILTDIRPIFDDLKGDEIQASVIIHNLKIEYLEDGRTHTAVFALDSSDLIDLNRMVLRAQQKEVALRNSLDKTNLTIIDISNG